MSRPKPRVKDLGDLLCSAIQIREELHCQQYTLMEMLGLQKCRSVRAKSEFFKSFKKLFDCAEESVRKLHSHRARHARLDSHIRAFLDAPRSQLRPKA